MATSSIRILLVDDFEPFRRFLSSILQYRKDIDLICEVSDGIAAIEKAMELQPDLILLDIGLPKLNGLQTARHIRKLSPHSRILFVSQESSVDVVEEAFSVGASGYIVKLDAGSEVPTAVDALLRGEEFVGTRLKRHNFTDDSGSRVRENFSRERFLLPCVPHTAENVHGPHRHEVQFYSDDAFLLDGFTQFIGTALEAGNSVILVATESHRENVLPRLQGYGVDVSAAIEEGRYLPLDAADTLSKITVNDLPDPERFLEAAANLIAAAVKSAKGAHPRVAICGECDPPLWMLGKGEAAIRLEQLWNEIAKTHDIDILCGYPLAGFHTVQGGRIFQRICAEHSAVYSR